MSAAIVTRYLGPTNYRGGRIVATADLPRPDGRRDADVRIVISYDHDSTSIEAHRTAARILVRTVWTPEKAPEIIAEGHLPRSERGAYVFLLGPARGPSIGTQRILDRQALDG